MFPFVIDKFQLKPMDVYAVDGKFFPLTKRRIRNLLMPEMGTVQKEIPGASSGFPAFQVPSDNAANQNIQLLNKISSMIFPADKAAFMAKVNQYKDCFLENKAFIRALNIIDNAEAIEPDKVHEKVASIVKPDVVQFRREGHKTIMKSASAMGYHMHEHEIERKDNDLIPSDIFGRMLSKGYHTVASPVQSDPDRDRGQVKLAETGKFHVFTPGGDAGEAYVFDVITLHGQPTDEKMICSQKAGKYSLQEKVAGIPLNGASPEIATEAPGGYGVFLIGENKCTEPVEIVYSKMEGENPAYMAKIAGVSIELTAVPYVVEPVSACGKILIPSGAGFMKLGEATRYVDDVILCREMITLPEGVTRKEIRYDKVTDSYEIRGEKIAGFESDMLNSADAEFILGLYGHSPNYAYAKMAEARGKGLTDFYALRQIVPMEQMMRDVEEEAKKITDDTLSLRRDLTKEAMVMPDEGTVDSALSLNFITPQNLAVYLDQIPQLQNSLSTLCELLLASRWGLKDIPESPLSSSIKALDEVTDKLETIKFGLQQSMRGM
ncbi:MAG: hypothetical protein KKD44_28425, partial [Proteobacteria bacterium]|nr:hypothetical protein [Pseudomonadota bacterium]